MTPRFTLVFLALGILGSSDHLIASSPDFQSLAALYKTALPSTDQSSVIAAKMAALAAASENPDTQLQTLTFQYQTLTQQGRQPGPAVIQFLTAQFFDSSLTWDRFIDARGSLGNGVPALPAGELVLVSRMGKVPLAKLAADYQLWALEFPPPIAYRLSVLQSVGLSPAMIRQRFDFLVYAFPPLVAATLTYLSFTAKDQSAGKIAQTYEEALELVGAGLAQQLVALSILHQQPATQLFETVVRPLNQQNRISIPVILELLKAPYLRSQPLLTIF